MNTFHERLAHVMSVHAVTPAMLAALTGLHVTNVCHMLHGRRAPSLTTLRKILCAVPHADARWLVCGAP